MWSKLMNILHTLSVVNCLFVGNTNYVACQSFSLDREYFGKRLTGHTLMVLSDMPLSICAMECFFDTECVSINYQQTTNVCEMNSASKAAVDPSEFEVDSTFIFSDLSIWPQNIGGACTSKPCRPGQKCSSNRGKHSCGCSYPAQTCAMVSKKSPRYDDGEYWLYSPLLKSNIKVYCHNMSSTDPKEYITLPAGNVAFSAGGPEESPELQRQRITFSKAGINVRDMTILPTDFAFSDYGDSPLDIRFGKGMACVGGQYSGSFSINLTGTGFALEPTVKIEYYIFQGNMHDDYRNAEGTQLGAWCYGYCSSCYVTQPITLQLNGNEDPSAASTPTCY